MKECDHRTASVGSNPAKGSFFRFFSTHIYELVTSWSQPGYKPIFTTLLQAGYKLATAL